MKIVHVTNTFPTTHTRTGGGEQACLRAIRGQMRAGGAAIVATTRFDGQPKDATIPVVAIPTIENYLGVFGRYAEVVKWYAGQFDPVAFISALRLLKREKPAAVHFHNMFQVTFAVLAAAKLRGIPAVLSVYDYWYFCPLSTLLDSAGTTCRRFHGTHCTKCLPGIAVPVQKILLAARKGVFDFFLNMIDRFIVLSKSSRDILAAYGIPGSKIDIVPVEIPTEFQTAGGKAEPEPATILFIGWLQKRKGLKVLLEAMEAVWKKMPQAKLRIITQEVKWEGEYRKEIDAILTEVPAGSCEFITGQLPRESIRKYLETAAVIVIPEQWENMSPLLVIEAMFMEKAIVASRIGGIPEFIENGTTGFLCVFDDPDAFAQAILAALSDSEGASIMGKRAGEKIRAAAGSQKTAELLSEVYGKL